MVLGVDGKAFAELADRPDARAAMRAELGAAPDDIVVLWVGRLSFFEKAFPQHLRDRAGAASRPGTSSAETSRVRGRVRLSSGPSGS